ncbi:hypothetical protein ABZ860_39015 [Microbispora sp. NPDC046973]|uniref:hypothetical protein n=1 Tax=Microbispora sp. NPDC046973 TaxID=3155022 RepID=UPI0033F21AA2
MTDELLVVRAQLGERAAPAELVARWRVLPQGGVAAPGPRTRPRAGASLHVTHAHLR